MDYSRVFSHFSCSGKFGFRQFSYFLEIDIGLVVYRELSACMDLLSALLASNQLYLLLYTLYCLDLMRPLLVLSRLLGSNWRLEPLVIDGLDFLYA